MLFVVFNFPPSKIFMGDSGSTILGFAIAFLGLDFCRSHGPTTSASTFPLVLSAQPLVDAALAIVRRIRHGTSPLEGDRRHLYDLLLARGWSPKRVALIWYATTLLLAVFGWLAVHARSIPALLPGLAAIALLVAFGARLGCLHSAGEEITKNPDAESLKHASFQQDQPPATTRREPHRI